MTSPGNPADDDVIADARQRRIRNAKDYQSYADRLADPGLMAGALITWWGALAVPVGGARRSGTVTFPGSDTEEGENLIVRMRELPELFPNPRIVGGEVEWGAPLPLSPVVSRGPECIELGRCFGYTEEAIAEFMRSGRNNEGEEE